jgi:hypothetical protein
MEHLMKMELLVQELRDQGRNPPPASVATHPWHLITSMLRTAKVIAQTKEQRSLNRQLKLQDSNDLVQTAPRRHRLIQPAASACLSLPLSNQAAPRRLLPAGLLLAKERLRQALELLPLELGQVRKQLTRH